MEYDRTYNATEASVYVRDLNITSVMDSINACMEYETYRVLIECDDVCDMRDVCDLIDNTYANRLHYLVSYSSHIDAETYYKKIILPNGSMLCVGTAPDALCSYNRVLARLGNSVQLCMSHGALMYKGYKIIPYSGEQTYKRTWPDKPFDFAPSEESINAFIFDDCQSI